MLSIPAYIIVNVEVHDRSSFDDYVRKVPLIVRKHSGEYLAVEDAPEVMEEASGTRTSTGYLRCRRESV